MQKLKQVKIQCFIWYDHLALESNNILLELKFHFLTLFSWEKKTLWHKTARLIKKEKRKTTKVFNYLSISFEIWVSRLSFPKHNTNKNAKAGTRMQKLKPQTPCGALNHHDASSEWFCTHSRLHQRTGQLWYIKISQPYTCRVGGTHKCTHSSNSSSSRAVSQGQRRRFIFIMGKGAKSCWYEGDYINANCIGELLVLEKVCM